MSDESQGSGGVRRPVPSSEVRGGKKKEVEEEERSDKESGKEGEESAGHGALCCSPHLSLPG